MVVSVATALCFAGLCELGVVQDRVLCIVWFGLCDVGLGSDLWPRGPGQPVTWQPNADSVWRNGQTWVSGRRKAQASLLERPSWRGQSKGFLLCLLGNSNATSSSWEPGGLSKDPLPRGQFLRSSGESAPTALLG